MFGRMAVALLVTLPFAGVVASVMWHLATLSNRTASVVIMTVIVVTLVGVLVVAIRRAPKAATSTPRPAPRRPRSRSGRAPAR